MIPRSTNSFFVPTANFFRIIDLKRLILIKFEVLNFDIKPRQGEEIAARRLFAL